VTEVSVIRAAPERVMRVTTVLLISVLACAGLMGQIGDAEGDRSQVIASADRVTLTAKVVPVQLRDSAPLPGADRLGRDRKIYLILKISEQHNRPE